MLATTRMNSWRVCLLLVVAAVWTIRMTMFKPLKDSLATFYLRKLSKTTDSSSSSPMSSSPVCNPKVPKHPIKRIYFAHMRKAGGTTISGFLRDTVQASFPSIEYSSSEGGKFEHPGTRNDTLYVTHIRHPVDRAISNFKYSGRWSCEKMVYKRNIEYPGWQPNASNANLLEHWMEKTETRKCF